MQVSQFQLTRAHQRPKVQYSGLNNYMSNTLFHLHLPLATPYSGFSSWVVVFSYFGQRGGNMEISLSSYKFNNVLKSMFYLEVFFRREPLRYLPYCIISFCCFFRDFEMVLMRDRFMFCGPKGATPLPLWL